MARPVKTPTSPDCRAEIRTAAQTLFADQGFARTTIREIAARAGVKWSLLYHYYPNKEELYLSLLEAAVSELVAQVEAIAASPDTPEEKIRCLVRAFHSYFQAHPQRFQLIQRAVDEHNASAQALAQRWISRAFVAFKAITRQGVEQGCFKPLPQPLLAFAISGLLEHSVRLQKLAGDISPDLSGDYLFAELGDLLVALLQTDRPGHGLRGAE